MADGIALEGIKLVLANLPRVLENPEDLEGRSRMLLASAMGSTAFQKGLGAAHAMAKALTAQNNLHHGTGITLVLPATIEWFEPAALTDEQTTRLKTVATLFQNAMSQVAYEDPTHGGKMIPVTRSDFAKMFETAMSSTN